MRGYGGFLGFLLFSSIYTIYAATPTAPTNLSATVGSSTSINLSWKDNSNDETNFLIERSTDNIAFTQIASLSMNIATYSDTGLTTNQIYYYRVYAKNADGSSAYSVTVSATPVTPFTEAQILRNIARVGYVKDSEVIKLGAKYLEKIQAKMDLSTRMDLRDSIMLTLNSDPAVITTLTGEARDVTAKLLGHCKLTNSASADIVKLIEGNIPQYAETAVIEFARTTKTMPTTEIMAALKAKPLNDSIREVALATADHDTIHYLLEIANAEKRFDPLYGLDSLEAVELVVKNYLDYFNAPAAPSSLTATLVTYNTVHLSWADNSTNEEEFQIFTAINEGGFNKISSVPGNTVNFAHSGLDPEKTYKYFVRAVNMTGDSTNSEEVSITTPAKPDPMPDPAPVAPELPKSLPGALTIVDLTKRLVISIEGRPHEESVSAMIQFVKTAHNPAAAVEASNVLAQKFDRSSFDYSPAMTSLGLRAISEVNARSAAEFNDFVLPENLRRLYGNTLRSNGMKLQDRFVKDDNPK